MQERWHTIISAEVLAVFQGCHHDWRGVRLPSGQIDLVPDAKLEHVVGPAGLCTWAYIGCLPASKRLPLHHGSSDVTVDISVTHLNMFLPVCYFPVIQGVDATGEAIGDSVGE